jgi:WD40 repeat protein
VYVEVKGVLLTLISIPFCSSDGSLLTYAAEDLSIGVINASTLQPVYRLRNAHENPIFTITVSTDNSFIASAAGNQLRVTPLPKTVSKGNNSCLGMITGLCYSVTKYLVRLGVDYSAPIYILLSMLMFALFAHLLVLKF